VARKAKTLNWWERVLAAVAGFAFALLAVAYVHDDHLAKIAAPSCTGAPDGCVITVNHEPNTALLVALAAAALFALVVALSGEWWSFKAGDIEISPPQASATSDEMVPKEAKKAVDDRATDAIKQLAAGDPPEKASAIVYKDLPPTVKGAAVTLWNQMYPESDKKLFESIDGAAQSAGAFYIRVKPLVGTTPIWMKVQ
jgi:hypothetical protein